MATIIERNGRFLARVRRQGFTPVSQTFHRRSDAAAWGRQVEADMEGGRWREDTSSGPAPTLRQAITTYKAGVGSALKGAETYAYWLNELALTVMAAKPIDRVTPADVSSWRDQMALKLKPSTVVRKLGMLSGLFTWAQKDCGWITTNPVHQVRKPRVSDGRDRTVSIEEMSFLRRAAFSSRSSWLPDALVVLQTSAMRRGELWALRTDDVDFEASTAHLVETKNGSSRDVPLCPRALVALRVLHDQATGAGRGTLLPVASAHAITVAFRRTLARARTLYERACLASNVPPLTTFLNDLRLHDFRHHAVSEWAATGALSVVELMAISGHKTPRMLARYTHLSPASLASKLATLRTASSA